MASAIRFQCAVSSPSWRRPARVSVSYLARRLFSEDSQDDASHPASSSRCSAGKSESRLHDERAAGDLLDPPGDPQTVQLPGGERLQNQEVERSLQQVFALSHRDIDILYET